MAEYGLAGYELGSWQAVFAPAGTPKAIVDRLYAEIGKILKVPDMVKRLTELGLDISGMPADDLGAPPRQDCQDSGATAN